MPRIDIQNKSKEERLQIKHLTNNAKNRKTSTGIGLPYIRGLSKKLAPMPGIPITWNRDIPQTQIIACAPYWDKTLRSHCDETYIGKREETLGCRIK